MLGQVQYLLFPAAMYVEFRLKFLSKFDFPAPVICFIFVSDIVLVDASAVVVIAFT